jgi:hypothetical protein
VGSRKQKIANTEMDNLVSNLRGEIGEIVTSWVLMRQFMASSANLATGDPKLDIGNQQLACMDLLTNKLRDELVGRLSELAERKVGKLTFFFASEKLRCLEDEIRKFESFIMKSGIREKRNRDVSHKELPEKWSDHKHRPIPYRQLLKAIARALRLMKRIDRIVLGPSAQFCWREARKRRYEFMFSPRAEYMLIPYLTYKV